MIKIAIVGSIGSGKTYISKLFGYPVFNADEAVSKIYLKNKKVLFKLKKKLPNFFLKFPIKKDFLIDAIVKDKNNIKKISAIVHPEVRKKLNIFLKRNKKKKAVILDIPLYLENKMNKKKDIIIFIQSNTEDSLKRIKKRKNFNQLVLKRLKNLQLPLSIKRKKSHFIIKNNFTNKSVKMSIKKILKEIL